MGLRSVIATRYVAALLGNSYLREWGLFLRLVWALLQVYIVERTYELGKKEGHFQVGDLPGLFIPRCSWRLQRLLPHNDRWTRWCAPHIPVKRSIYALLLLPFLVAYAGLWMGWMPPLSFLMSTFLLLVLKTGMFVNQWSERTSETKHREAAT